DGCLRGGNSLFLCGLVRHRPVFSLLSPLAGAGCGRVAWTAFSVAGDASARYAGAAGGRGIYFASAPGREGPAGGCRVAVRRAPLCDPRRADVDEVRTRVAASASVGMKAAAVAPEPTAVSGEH